MKAIEPAMVIIVALYFADQQFAQDKYSGLLEMKKPVRDYTPNS